MMLLKIVTGIADHFEARLVEWAMAVATLVYGLNLMTVDDEQWRTAAAWTGLVAWADRATWSLVCVGSSSLWLAALTINGTFAGTAYSRFSPHVRAAVALIAAVIWFKIFLSVVPAGTSGRGIYGLPLALSIWCVINAWRDTGRVKGGRGGMA